MTATYTGLFEDEVAELLRLLPFRSTIDTGSRTYCPSAMITEDGIYSSGEGYYTEYLNGQYTGNRISRIRLIERLIHSTFTVTQHEKETTDGNRRRKKER